MTGDELRQAIERLWPGHGGQAKATRHFGWSDSRTLRKYLSGEKAVPDHIAIEVANLLAQFPRGIRSVDPRASLAVLHGQMVGQGFTDGEAAAGILGAATALALRHMERQDMLDMIGGSDA